MSANSELILKEALALPLQERAELVERLLATLRSPADPQIDDLWVREAEDRVDAMIAGLSSRVRGCLVNRFPHSVIYKSERSAHHSRNSKPPSRASKLAIES